MFSGNRPSETGKLTYGDVKVDEHKLPNGVTTLRGIVEISRDTKTGKRTMVMNGTSIRRIYDHFHYSKHPRWLSYEVTDETPLFVNPYTGKSIHQESFRQHYKKCLEFSGLVDKGYTLYSLRSTHITKLLLEGSSVEDISRNLGNSPEVVRRHYDGVENILKSDELLKLNRHYFQDRLQIVTILNDNDGNVNKDVCVICLLGCHFTETEDVGTETPDIPWILVSGHHICC